MTTFAPVRAARALWATTYAEQLPLYTDDLTVPALLRAARPPLPRRHTPGAERRGGLL